MCVCVCVCVCVCYMPALWLGKGKIPYYSPSDYTPWGRMNTQMKSLRGRRHQKRLFNKWCT